MLIKLLGSKISASVSEEELCEQSSMEQAYHIRTLNAVIYYHNKPLKVEIRTDGQVYIKEFDIWISRPYYEEIK